MVRAPLLRRNADLSRKRPALIVFREAHFPKASKKNICLFGFAKWYNIQPSFHQKALTYF
jgi:hypothetical protein